MGKFSLTGHFPILEFKAMKGPMIFLKSGDRQIELRKAVRHQGKFFQTNDAVFELDGEYSYNAGGQSALFYNLYNSKPISLIGIEKIQRLYRQRKAHLIVRELSRIDTAIEASAEKHYTDPIKAMKELYSKIPEEITQADQKFLIDYRTFDKNDLKLQNVTKMNAKKVNTGMSTKVPTILPMMIIAGIAIAVVVFMMKFNPLNYINF